MRNYARARATHVHVSRSHIAQCTARENLCPVKFIYITYIPDALLVELYVPSVRRYISQISEIPLASDQFPQNVIANRARLKSFSTTRHLEISFALVTG